MCSTGAGSGCADRPDRLVGDDEGAVGRPVEGVARAARRCAAAAYRRRPACSARRCRAPGSQAVAQRRGGLRAHDLVGLAEQPPPLGVADLDDADADLGELAGADLAGERAGVLGRGILRADDRAGVPSNASSARADLQIGRDDEELDASVGDGADARATSSATRANHARGLAMPEVHLEAHAHGHARGHQQLPVCSYSSMAATFSAEAEVGSKR